MLIKQTFDLNKNHPLTHVMNELNKNHTRVLNERSTDKHHTNLCTVIIKTVQVQTCNIDKMQMKKCSFIIVTQTI